MARREEYYGRLLENGEEEEEEDDDDDEDDDTPYCLSMHQPWASLLIAGIKRVEGRGWPTRHRGRLWIASTAKEPEEADVAAVEQQYVARHASRHARGGPNFPAEYPPSALLGCVRLRDCLAHDDYAAAHPDGEENESAYLFMCDRPRTLRLPVRISGQHKIWTLDTAVHQAARASLRPRGWKPAARAAAARRAAPDAALGEELELEELEELEELQRLQRLHLGSAPSPGGGLGGLEGGLGGDEGDQEDLELQLALTLSASEAEAPSTLPPGLGRSAAPPGLGAPQGLASGVALPPGLPPGLNR